jgi:broad specificity phosphatase PhoE
LRNEYRRNPGLTELGKVQSQKSASVFLENSMDELWVSPLNRAQETHTPFKEKKYSKKYYNL